MLTNDIRARFSRILRRDEVYLANHSLGRPLDRTAEDVRRALDLWYSDMDASWDAWIEEMDTWRGNTAKLLGISRADGIVPKTSAGQGLRAVLNAFPQDRPVRVLTTRGEFDSIDFILKTYAQRGRAQVTWTEHTSQEGPVPIYTIDPLLTSLEAGSYDLVVVSQVFFGTGQLLRDLPKLVQAAHNQGALLLVDLYHAAGVIPLQVEADGFDFAIGGSYKYLRGGPGACWLAVHPRHLDGSSDLRSLDTGWFAKKDTFGYERSDEAQFAEGGNGWLESTPPVLMPYQAKAGLAIVLELGVENIRRDSLAHQQRMREAFRVHGTPLFEPADPSAFGAFSLLGAEDAKQLSTRLKQIGVNTDSRGRFVRFGPDLLNTDEEFKRAAEATASLLQPVL